MSLLRHPPETPSGLLLLSLFWFGTGFVSVNLDMATFVFWFCYSNGWRLDALSLFLLSSLLLTFNSETSKTNLSYYRGPSDKIFACIFDWLSPKVLNLCFRNDELSLISLRFYGIQLRVWRPSSCLHFLLTPLFCFTTLRLFALHFSPHLSSHLSLHLTFHLGNEFILSQLCW